MTAITLHGLRKQFGETVAVDGVDLEVASGELFFLLGPSGCGKTTLLRMLAGFTDPSAGSIRFGERDVTHLAPNRRNTGMVFQGYALWPHMTVWQNVAFGLDVRKVSAEDKQRRVEQALKRVHMLPLADRKPNQLSGGQQQRVALARALVIEPTVLLLDEPLSNLDAKLRTQMRQQIREICKDAGITAVYVTHDQKEALSMADRVAVMQSGRIVQVGPPRKLYERPANRFVADFLGETNFVSAEVKGRDNGHVILETTAGTLLSSVYPDDLPATGNVTCSIRPEALKLEPVDADGRHEAAVDTVGSGHGVTPGSAAETAGPPTATLPRNTFTATPTDVIYLGEIAQYQLLVGDQLRLKAFELDPKLMDRPRQALRVRVAPEAVVILRD